MGRWLDTVSACRKAAGRVVNMSAEVRGTRECKLRPSRAAQRPTTQYHDNNTQHDQQHNNKDRNIIRACHGKPNTAISESLPSDLVVTRGDGRRMHAIRPYSRPHRLSTTPYERFLTTYEPYSVVPKRSGRGLERHPVSL